VLPGLNREFVTRCIHPKDLQNPDVLANPCDVTGLAQRAETILKYGFARLQTDTISIRGNVAHCVRSTPHAVVLRSLNRILRPATGTKPSDRDTIIRRLDTILREGVQHRVYKFDIKSFFESLDRRQLFNRLALVTELPRSALITLQNYFNELTLRDITGLPRGIQLSATLSEISLQQFDDAISHTVTEFDSRTRRAVN
jgi:hypothetical protein